jgi:hypothetical protein
VSSVYDKVQDERYLYKHANGIYYLRKQNQGEKDTHVSLGTTLIKVARELRDDYLAVRRTRKLGIAAPEPKPEQIKDEAVPTHAIMSDLLTRWNGWSLVVVDPGNADRTDESRDNNNKEEDKLKFKIEVDLPPDVPADEKLPRLRFGSEYTFRLRYADLAGNHAFDENFDDSGPAGMQSLRAYLNSVDTKCRFLRPTRGPDATKPDPAPLLLARQIGNPDDASFEVVRASTDKPEGELPRSRLLLVSDPLQHKTPVVLEATPQWLLPSPCCVTTVIQSGKLDSLGHPSRLFDQHEKHFTDGTYRCVKLFPRPIGLSNRSCRRYCRGRRSQTSF